MESNDELGAEGTTAPSVSVALSRELPGPAVPGFQNCSDMVVSGQTRRSNGEARTRGRDPLQTDLKLI